MCVLLVGSSSSCPPSLLVNRSSLQSIRGVLSWSMITVLVPGTAGATSGEKMMIIDPLGPEGYMGLYLRKRS